MPRSAISVDPRIEAIARMCGMCKSLADIGTDHGRLGAYLLQTGRCERVEFTDISGASLEKARRLISVLGLAPRAEFLVGDGALALREPPDVAVIAGMGGETIAGILARGKRVLEKSRIVMQPNVAAPELRAAIQHSGFRIADERIVHDGRRLYVVIAAERGVAAYDDAQLNVGPVLMETRPEELLDFARFRIRVAQKALKGIRLAGADGAAVEKELAIWEEVARWRKPIKCDESG